MFGSEVVGGIGCGECWVVVWILDGCIDVVEDVVKVSVVMV